jgi:hypothetical protein
VNPLKSYSGPRHCEGAGGAPMGGPEDPLSVIEELVEGGGSEGVA